MKKGISLYLITLFIAKITIAQADSSFALTFQTTLINNYSEIAKVSKENYFQILGKAAESTFNDQNPNYRKALLEISKSQHITESKAVEKLFEQTFAALRKDFLWNSAPVSSLDKQILNVYNKSLCPCMSSRASKESFMEVVLKAQQECTTTLITDTVFLNELKRVAGHNTLNDMYRLQRYLPLLMYEKCELLNYKFNIAIKDMSVIEKYHQLISNKRRQESINVLALYEKNNLDSLKLIFPLYTKYIPLLKEAIKSRKKKKNKVDVYYRGSRINNSNPAALLDIHDEDGIGLQLTLNYSEHALNATITTAQIKRFEPSKGNEVIETKVISVMPAEKKN